METKRSARRLAGAAWLALVSSAAVAWGDPPGASSPHDGPTVVKGVVVTARHRPVDAPPPPEAYAAPPKFEHVALSPDATQVAAVMTVAGVRLLVARRLADDSVRVVRLTGGDVSSISWADNDHILLTSARSGLRGTCAADQEALINVQITSAIAAMQNFAESFPPGSVDAADARSSAMSLGAPMQQHPCVYYGVREESAVTSVDVERKSGRIVGLRFGDYSNRPLGAPQPVTIEGKPQLAGPFLELRTTPVAYEPADRVFLWRIDPKTTTGRLFDDRGGDPGREARYVDDWLLDRQGAIVARSLYDFDKQLFVIQTKTGGAWRPVLTRKIDAKLHTFAPYMIGLGRHDGSIVILDAAAQAGADAAGRTFHYYELAPDGGLSGPLEPVDAARDRPVFDPGTGHLAGFLQSGAEDRYVLSDPDLQSLYQNALNAVPGQTVEIVSTADDPRKMIIHAEGGEDPGSYYFVDFSTGASKALGEDYAQIPSAWLADQRQITYKAADGLEISAILTLPPKPEPHGLPLVVLPHDGPQTHDRLGFDWLAQALASRGYLVLQPNYRGSDGDGRAFMEAGYGQLGRKMQSDLSDGVRQLAAEGLADPKRVCIVGVGMGGYAALTAAATEAATYRCAASLDGVSDPEAFAGWLKDRRAKGDQDQITTLAADVRQPRTFVADPGSPQILKSYLGAGGGAPVPVKLAADVAIPVLLVSESDGKAAPARESRAMRDALQAHGKAAVEFVDVKGAAEQPLSTNEARLAALTALVDFLAKQNPAP